MGGGREEREGERKERRGRWNGGDDEGRSTAARAGDQNSTGFFHTGVSRKEH
jgi:hypothetical protein